MLCNVCVGETIVNLGYDGDIICVDVPMNAKDVGRYSQGSCMFFVYDYIKLWAV